MRYQKTPRRTICFYNKGSPKRAEKNRLNIIGIPVALNLNEFNEDAQREKARATKDTDNRKRSNYYLEIRKVLGYIIDYK